MIIEKILGEKTKIKILRFFFDYPLIKRNVREVATECRQGFGQTARDLKELKEMGILSMEKSGKEMLYHLNKGSKLYHVLKGLFEVEKEQIDLPFFYRNLLADLVTKTKRVAEACLLFGSLVTGEYKMESDVDLFFISDKEDEIRKICSQLEDRYGVKIQVIVIKPGEMKEFRKSGLFKTLKKESLTLFGREIASRWLR